MILINSSPGNALRMFQPFMPIFVPVGIGCIVSAFREKNINIDFVDEQIEENILEVIEEKVKDLKKPYIFGFSVLTAAYRNALATSKKVKAKYPDCVIVMGGIHPTAMPDEVIQNDQVDIILRGEGERLMFELYQCIKEGGDLADIPNIYYKENGKVMKNEFVFELVDVNNLPEFPYDLFAKKEYDLGFIVSSRGCPYDCIFCSNRITTGKKYRYYPAKRIVNELETIYSYGKDFVLFLDDNFLVSKKRAYDLISEIKSRGLHEKMTFSFQCRGDNVDYQILKDLFDAGFKSVFFGLETANENLMKIIKKGETVDDCVRAVLMARDIGYHVSATFIYGLPTETHQDRMDAIQLALDLKLDQVRFNNATPYPGTELYGIAQSQMRLNVQGVYENFISVGTFIENPFKKIPFTYVPPEVTESELRADILFSYLAFYCNLETLKIILFNPKQGVGWFVAGNSLSEFLKKLPALIALFSVMGIKFAQLFWGILFKKNTKLTMRTVLKGLLGKELGQRLVKKYEHMDWKTYGAKNSSSD
jgi:radical SAM superfamily enzyme YgiQ (UPF0313 family)